MPLTPAQRAAYGPGWAEFSAEIRFGRARGRCECHGECGAPVHLADEGRCGAVHGEPSPYTGSRVVLTTAHLHPDDDLAARDPDRVLAMCQLCHLNYDRDLHARNAGQTRAKRTAERRLGMEPLEGM